jgi:hypothetical protein
VVSESSFAVNLPAPAEGASGGYVTQALSLQIESCGPGPQPICKTTLPHALPDPPAAAIASIRNADLATPDGPVWPFMTTVELAGTPTGADGVWGAYRVGAGLRLAGAAPAGACEADCGTAKRRPSVQVFGFHEEPRLNGSRVYTVVSENEVRLDDVAEATAEASGGFLSLDPNPYPRLAVIDRNARNVVFDRCWIHGRGFPTRVNSAIALYADDSAVLDSVVTEVNSWRPVTPQGGTSDSGVHGYFAGTAITLQVNDASWLTIRNTLFENCIGITVYAEQFRSTPGLSPHDVVISGNTFRNSDAYRAGSRESNGRYYGIRHAIEFKRGERILIDGNVLDGNWADWTPLGPAIGLLTRAAGASVNNRIQDVTIRNNVFRRVATGVQLLTTDDKIELPSLPIARVAVTNNLFENVDFYQMRSAPSGVGAIAPSTNFGGQLVFVTGSLEDLIITKNTAVDNRGTAPAPFWFHHGRSSGVRITDNVFTHNHDFRFGGMPPARNASEFEAEVEGSASDVFAYVFTQTPGPDPNSTFARNLILPGVRDSSLPEAYDDADPRLNFTKADCEAFYAGFEDIECAGSGEPGETANQRIATVFPNRADLHEAMGRGADLEQSAVFSPGIEVARALVGEAGATLEFQTGSSQTCFVDVSEAADFGSFQRFQTNGGTLQTVSLGSLAGGRTYHYRIKCASDTRFGEVTVP